MIYILFGENQQAKDQKIKSLKDSYLKSSDEKKLDLESLDANKLNSEIFKQALISLPALSKQRVVFVYQCEKLNDHNKELILEFSLSGNESVVLILDFATLDQRTGFSKQLLKTGESFNFSQKEEKNVFAMTREMEAGRTAQALKVMHELIDNGDHPLKLMGGLIWFWGQNKNRLGKERFKKGLLEIQEADINIKRSRLKPEESMEICVTKLSLLIAC